MGGDRKNNEGIGRGASGGRRTERSTRREALDLEEDDGKRDDKVEEDEENVVKRQKEG